MRNNVLSADNQQGRLNTSKCMSKNIHPQYIVGFVDGEGSFHVAIYQDIRMKIGIKIIPEFHISQHVSSKQVLDLIQRHLDCGYIKENHAANERDKTFVYVVRNRKDLLLKIIPFFERNQLHTEKQADFVLFAKIARLMQDGEHRKRNGAKKILALAYKMNRQGKYRRIRSLLDEIKIKAIRNLPGKVPMITMEGLMEIQHTQEVYLPEYNQTQEAPPRFHL